MLIEGLYSARIHLSETGSKRCHLLSTFFKAATHFYSWIRLLDSTRKENGPDMTRNAITMLRLHYATPAPFTTDCETHLPSPLNYTICALPQLSLLHSATRLRRFIHSATRHPLGYAPSPFGSALSQFGYALSTLTYAPSPLGYAPFPLCYAPSPLSYELFSQDYAPPLQSRARRIVQLLHLRSYF